MAINDNAVNKILLIEFEPIEMPKTAPGFSIKDIRKKFPMTLYDFPKTQIFLTNIFENWSKVNNIIKITKYLRKEKKMLFEVIIFKSFLFKFTIYAKVCMRHSFKAFCGNGFSAKYTNPVSLAINHFECPINSSKMYQFSF
jgi:hypothetical protein